MTTAADANSANPSIMRDTINAVSATYVVLTSTATDITSVSLGFISGSTANFIDDFTFSRGAASTATPEPSTLALTGLVFSALMIRQKKR